MITNKKYAWILMVGGIVGILTSSLLTLDKIKLLENPTAELPCNINPLISCGPVINTPQASVLGDIPNPMLGLIGFSVVFATGLLILFGANPDRRFWKLITLGMIAAIIFIHWLFYQSVYQIGALCLYCMITWVAVWPLFLYTLKNYLNNSFLNKNHLAILIGWYLLILLLILSHFRDFFFN